MEPHTGTLQPCTPTKHCRFSPCRITIANRRVSNTPGRAFLLHGFVCVCIRSSQKPVNQKCKIYYYHLLHFCDARHTWTRIKPIDLIAVSWVRLIELEL